MCSILQAEAIDILHHTTPHHTTPHHTTPHHTTRCSNFHQLPQPLQIQQRAHIKNAFIAVSAMISGVNIQAHEKLSFPYTA